MLKMDHFSRLFLVQVLKQKDMISRPQLGDEIFFLTLVGDMSRYFKFFFITNFSFSIHSYCRHVDAMIRSTCYRRGVRGGISTADL